MPIMCDNWQAHMLRYVWHAQSICLRRTAPCVFNTAVLFTFPFFLLYSIGIFQYFLRFSTNIFCVIVVHINNKQRVESTVDPYSHNFDGLSTSAAHKESAIMSFVFLLDQTNSSNIRNNWDESLWTWFYYSKDIWLRSYSSDIFSQTAI